MFTESVIIHLEFKSISRHFISCFGINCLILRACIFSILKKNALLSLYVAIQ